MIFIDFETRSRVDLKKCGTSVYARHPSTEVMCLCWSKGSSVNLWFPDKYCHPSGSFDNPEALLRLIEAGELVEAHNVFFERNIWRHICHARYGWPDIHFDQWRCSMAASCRLALPRSLEDVGAALKLPIQKDSDGRKVMLALSKPKRNGEFDRDVSKLSRLYSYCATDVKSEIAIHNAIEPMPKSELKLWQLDQRINLRGLQVDRFAIRSAMKLVDAVLEETCSELESLTGGKVKTPKQVAALIDWINSQLSSGVPTEGLKRVEEYADTFERSARKYEGGNGLAVGSAGIDERMKADALRSIVRRVRKGEWIEGLESAVKAECRQWIERHNARRPKDVNWARWDGCCDSTIETAMRWLKVPTFVGEPIKDLTASTVDEWLDRSDLPDNVRRALELRRTAAKASTAKLKAMLDRCDEDGRVRGNLVYHGAATGRWAGSGIQIQNFPRGTLSPDEIELVHRLLPSEGSQALDLILGPPMDCISSSLRSMIRAADGKRLLVADFASIEARVLAWIAGQDDLVALFAANGDVYKAMASKIYEIEVDEVTKAQRQMGKIAILGLGYGMGHKAFQQACYIMAGVTIDQAFAKNVVKTYRKAHTEIAQFWSDLNTACIRTIETRKPHRVGRLEMSCDGAWLRIKLPSGRRLHYRKPTIVSVVAPWSVGYVGTIYAPKEMQSHLESLDIELGERIDGAWTDCDVPLTAHPQLKGLHTELEEKEPKKIPQIQHEGVNSLSRKWSKVRTYGGKLCENIVQAIARDFLAESMLRLESHGYEIVATVHDEIICEVDRNFGSVERMCGLMAEVPAWGKGCPIAVEGFESVRYQK